MPDTTNPIGFTDANELREKNRATVEKYMNTKGQDRLRRHECRNRTARSRRALRQVPGRNRGPATMPARVPARPRRAARRATRRAAPVAACPGRPADSPRAAAPVAGRPAARRSSLPVPFAWLFDSAPRSAGGSAYRRLMPTQGSRFTLACPSIVSQPAKGTVGQRLMAARLAESGGRRRADRRCRLFHLP